MSNIVKVWNRNSFDHKELFKDDAVFIPAGKYIEMDYYDAVQFLGQFYPMKFGKDGIQDPKSYKWLEIDPEDKKKVFQSKGDKDEKDQVFVCHRCNKEFLTKNGLLKHIKTRHLDEMADKDARDELIDDEDV